MARFSPARQHRQAKLAAKAHAEAAPGGEITGSQYQLMLAQLAEHRRALKHIQSVERKIEAKRSFLPVYDTWVKGALENGTGAQDLVLTTLLIWHIDVGNFDIALDIAAYAVQHALELPDQYERTMGTALIDEFGDAALRGKMSKTEAVGLLTRVMRLTNDLDAPDQARAKLYKAMGYALIGKVGSTDTDLSKVPPTDAKDALQLLQRALDLHDQVGVKKDIERLDRHLKKLGESEAP